MSFLPVRYPCSMEWILWREKQYSSSHSDYKPPMKKREKGYISTTVSWMGRMSAVSEKDVSWVIVVAAILTLLYGSPEISRDSAF